MNKKIITAIFAAAVISTALCGCSRQKPYVPSNEQAASEQAEKLAVKKEKITYNKGNVTCSDFSFFADPALWNYTESSDDTCDFRMKAYKDLTTCGVSLFSSDEKVTGQDAQMKVLSVINNADVVSTGTLATADRTFYYYEYSINEDLHARTYIADNNDKYICAYVESNNFGYIDGKIADLLSSIQLTDAK